MSEKRHVVAALVYDGLCTFEFGIAVELFGLSRPEFDFPWYDFRIVAGEPGNLRAAGGMALSVGAPADIRLAQTVIVPGWRSPTETPSANMIAALREAYASGARIIAICGGAFVVAEAGLLDDRRATTHWMFTDELRRRYPKVRVDPRALYVDEGRVLTSAGSAAGIDLCLHVIRRDYGCEVVNRVARRLVAQPYREGGQAQFIDMPTVPRHNGHFAELFPWMEQNIHQEISVASLAARARMSERTFLRHFKKSTGISPSEWILRERSRRSQRLLESTDLPIDLIAQASGFSSVEAFRYHFRRLVGNSPSSYRKAFAGQPKEGVRAIECRPEGHVDLSGTLPPSLAGSRT